MQISTETLQRVRKELTTVLFFALFGGATAFYAPATASGPCPVSGGACTNSCWWGFGGCECTMVDCVNGECRYSNCECCTACIGAGCSGPGPILP